MDLSCSSIPKPGFYSVLFDKQSSIQGYTSLQADLLKSIFPTLNPSAYLSACIGVRKDKSKLISRAGSTVPFACILLCMLGPRTMKETGAKNLSFKSVF